MLNTLCQFLVFGREDKHFVIYVYSFIRYLGVAVVQQVER